MNIFVKNNILKNKIKIKQKKTKSLGLFFLIVWNCGISVPPTKSFSARSQGAKANVQKAVEEQQQDAKNWMKLWSVWMNVLLYLQEKTMYIYILLYDMWYMWIWYKSTHNFSSIHILQCSVTSLMWLLAFCTCINETFRKTWKSKGPPKDSLTAAVPGQGCRGTKIPVVGGRGPPVPDGQTDDKLLDVGVSYFRTKPGSWTQAGPDMKDPQKK
jgi:hypothetical protein